MLHACMVLLHLLLEKPSGGSKHRSGFRAPRILKTLPISLQTLANPLKLQASTPFCLKCLSPMAERPHPALIENGDPKPTKEANDFLKSLYNKTLRQPLIPKA